MYKCKENGLTYYETFGELLNTDIIDAFEYNENYYISPRPEWFHDERVWKVNKKTKQLTVIHLVETFLFDEDKKIPLDVETLKKTVCTQQNTVRMT